MEFKKLHYHVQYLFYENLFFLNLPTIDPFHLIIVLSALLPFLIGSYPTCP